MLKPPFNIHRDTGFSARVNILLNGAPMPCTGLTPHLRIREHPTATPVLELTPDATGGGSTATWASADLGQLDLNVSPTDAQNSGIFGTRTVPAFTRAYVADLLLLDGDGAPSLRAPIPFPFQFVEAGAAKSECADSDPEISVSISTPDITVTLEASAAAALSGLAAGQAVDAAAPVRVVPGDNSIANESAAVLVSTLPADPSNRTVVTYRDGYRANVAKGGTARGACTWPHRIYVDDPSAQGFEDGSDYLTVDSDGGWISLIFIASRGIWEITASSVQPPTTHGRPHVGADKNLYGADGKLLFLLGMHESAHFGANFSDGYRRNWFVRNSQMSADPVADFSPPINSGVNAPKWLSLAYVSPAAFRAKLDLHKQIGLNVFKVWAGIGMIYTQPFTDPVSGLSFPHELEVLDDMQLACAERGIYLWIGFAHGSAPTTPADAVAAGCIGSKVEFWQILARRYRNAWNVFFDALNESGSGSIYNDVNNPQATVAWTTVMTSVADWAAELGAIINAIRGEGFINPICIFPYHNLYKIDGVMPTVLTTDPFQNDPNLILSIHPYYIFGDVETPFSASRPVFNSYSRNYANGSRDPNDPFATTAGSACVVISAVGLSNNFVFADPTDAAALAWLDEAIPYFMDAPWSGLIFFTSYPDTSTGEINNIFDDVTGKPTPWGQLLIGYATSAADSKLVKMVPQIAARNGALGDVSRSSVRWRRNGGELECYVKYSIVIDDNGDGATHLLLGLPMSAPTDGFQYFTARSSAGDALIVELCGATAQITKLDGSYPGANGVTISGTLQFFAQGKGIAVYTPYSFDGSTWLTRGGALTGVSDGKQGVAYFSLAMTGGDSVLQYLLTTNNGHFFVARLANGQIQVTLKNSAGQAIGQAISHATLVQATERTYGIIGWDFGAVDVDNNPAPILYMNVSGSLGTINLFTPGNGDYNVDYTDTDFAIGGQVNGQNLLQADVDFIWVDNTYLAFQYAIENGNFVDRAFNMVEIGVNGTRVSGSLPMVCVRRIDTVESFYKNRGYGGGFTKQNL